MHGRRALPPPPRAPRPLPLLPTPVRAIGMPGASSFASPLPFSPRRARTRAPPAMAGSRAELAATAARRLCTSRHHPRLRLVGLHPRRELATDVHLSCRQDASPRSRRGPALVAAVRTRGLAAAPCPSVSGDQLRSCCGHPVPRSSFSPLVASYSTAAAGLRAAEPHARAASPPHSSSGRARGTSRCASMPWCFPALPPPPASTLPASPTSSGDLSALISRQGRRA
jgi:hypothetical protein